MQSKVQKRWIGNMILEAGRDMPALPWTRAAKRARRIEMLKTQARVACV